MFRARTQVSLAGFALACGMGHAEAPPASSSIESVVPCSGGFSLSPRDAHLIAYARPDARGVFQVRVLDRETHTDRCLTCEPTPGAPPIGKHKRGPRILPDGLHVVIHVERAQRLLKRASASPHAIVWNDLWIATLDGARWWPLTHYADDTAREQGAFGVQVSPDGAQLAWTHRLGDESGFGWQVEVAKLAWKKQRDGSLAPALVAPRSYEAKQTTRLETLDWSPDGRFVMLASDRERAHSQRLNLWKLEVASGALTPLTTHDDARIDFGAWSPDGTRIAFGSSQDLDGDPERVRQTLRSDLWVMNTDGTQLERLTYFNSKNHPHGVTGGAAVAAVRWSEDSAQIFFETPTYSRWGQPRGSWLKVMSSIPLPQQRR